MESLFVSENTVLGASVTLDPDDALQRFNYLKSVAAPLRNAGALLARLSPRLKVFVNFLEAV